MKISLKINSKYEVPEIHICGSENTAEIRKLYHTVKEAVEEKLDKTKFVRISNSEIVNLKKIKRLDTSVTGTIKMYLQSDIETYVSRRCISKIKAAFEKNMSC